MLKRLYRIVSAPMSARRRRTRIVWAYRLFLDREPESGQVVAEKADRLPDTCAIRREFLQSEEARGEGRVCAGPTLTGLEAPMPIEQVSAPG